MSFTIVFNTLADAYRALMLSCGGHQVLLRVPGSHPLLVRDVIVCGFVSESIFQGPSDSGISYDRLMNAYDSLNALSPNTIYAERAFAVQPRNIARDFANMFRSRQYRQIYESQTPPRFAGCALSDAKVLRRAPAYRLNLSRHLVAVLRTIHSLGGRVEIGDRGADGDHTCCLHTAACAPADTLGMYTIPNGKAPAPANTLYLEGGVWLYNRCSTSYMAIRGDVADAMAIVRDALPGCALAQDDAEMVASIPWSAMHRPLDAWAAIQEESSLLSPEKMDGGDFEFAPSRPDVLGYSDYCFDLVKRMDIDVNLFRNAVYDYGTHIEDIINDTYDLYPQYHSGPKAFDAAVARWRENELRF